MRVLVKTCKTLSAVMRALAQAHALHEQGHTVFVEALPRFHDFFRCAGYCKPTNPMVDPPAVDETHEVSTAPFDPPPLDYALWFQEHHYRIDHRPVVSVYGLGWDPAATAERDTVLARAKELLGDRPYYVLTEDQNYWNDGIHISPYRVRDLPGLIAHADEFWAPESTALHIAYSVRPADTTFRIETNEVLPEQERVPAA